ncbi:TPA: transferrin-binding protein-like solute binding protein [Neisseria subflava]
MSNIQTKLKTIVFTAVSAAILSACGGGGGGSAALRTGSTPTNNTSNSAGNNGKKPPSTKLTNSADKLDELTDEAPIDPANVTQPLHTHFISSEGAQQSNPNVQIRRNAAGNLFQTDNQDRNQNGLISSLDFNNNDEVKINGVVLFNKTSDGNATQPTWTSAASVIAKVYSKGNTQTDVSEQTGKEKNTKFAYGKSTLDERIVELYKKSETEKNPVKKEELKTLLDENLKSRAKLAEMNEEASKKLAYFRLGQDGLVFGTQFDGVYVISFDDNTQIVLHDPSAAGWTYQTFAHYTVPDKTPHKGYQGYQSLGDETAFATLPDKGTATYQGISTAYVVIDNKNRQLTSNVMAIVDFGLKGVRFETSNSHFHTLEHDKRVSTVAENYNFKGTASWKKGNLFSGQVSTADNKLSGNLNGKFFGPKAEEIGGTYGLKNQDATEHLIGGYGAKRQ